MRPNFYQEQRFGINNTDKPSLVRKNFRSVKPMSLNAKPLDSVIRYSKAGIDISRNVPDDLNKTHDHTDDYKIPKAEVQGKLFIISFINF